MSKLLYIKANIKPEGESRTFRISDSFIDEYKNSHPQDEIITLDLYKERIGFLEPEDLNNVFGAKTEESKNHPIMKYAYQFAEADKYIISTPMWNLGVPAIVKAYFDYVSLAGVTFKYTENGPVGLCKNKKAVFITSSGGEYSSPEHVEMDMCSRYIKVVLDFFGITDYQKISAENLDLQGVVLGFLICSIDRSDSDVTRCWTPVWGYGALGDNRENILSRLFHRIADDLCRKEKVHFQMKLYAHDENIVRLFSFMQFGIECEEGICCTDEEIGSETKIQIRELDKQEVQLRWSEIWNVLSCLIHHLQKSPVFYPGKEFTEELYKTFFMDSNTYVYVALVNNRIIGLIEANTEKSEFVGDYEECYNTGEAFVIEEYRGRGVAQALLHYVIKSLRTHGIKYLWVEHGTANPNARGFWNKYFSTYCYIMTRDISV